MSADRFQVPDIPLSSPMGTPADEGHRPELRPLPTRLAVFVVEDDPTQREIMRGMLRPENCDVMIAADGSQALTMLTGLHRIDLLIADFELPDMDGRHLAQVFRERFPGLRVLYETAYADHLFERGSMEENSAFLEKPFTARGLREAARIVLFDALNPV
jgi:CheY-like chemotaxis protein